MKDASLWRDAGELPDRDDEPEEKWPAVGREYELVVAVAPDSKALVIDGPEEFWTVARDSGSHYDDGSLHLREWMPRELPAGVYRVRARYVHEAGEGEMGSHDPSCDLWYFEPVAYKRLPVGLPTADWAAIPGA